MNPEFYWSICQKISVENLLYSKNAVIGPSSSKYSGSSSRTVRVHKLATCYGLINLHAYIKIMHKNKIKQHNNILIPPKSMTI